MLAIASRCIFLFNLPIQAVGLLQRPVSSDAAVDAACRFETRHRGGALFQHETNVEQRRLCQSIAGKLEPSEESSLPDIAEKLLGWCLGLVLRLFASFAVAPEKKRHSVSGM